MFRSFARTSAYKFTSGTLVNSAARLLATPAVSTRRWPAALSSNTLVATPTFKLFNRQQPARFASTSSTITTMTSTNQQQHQPAADERPKILQWDSKDGEFRRQVSSFRNTVEADPNALFPAEAGRYHLYVSLACPWAHRTLIARALKGLESVISVSVVHYHMGTNGWHFLDNENDTSCPGATHDHLYGAKYLRELYFKANPDYEGRFTVPVLWDKKTHTIVNNESSEIIRIFNTAFDAFSTRPGTTYYPADLRAHIDALNDWIYPMLNNGVYRAGFATAQDAYERAVADVHTGLEKLDAHLASTKGPWLLGETLTEADIRLYTTIVRFDPVYTYHFKCVKSVQWQYPRIVEWAARLHMLPGVKDTFNLEHIKKHYYLSHKHINPFGVVPVATGPDFEKVYADMVAAGKA
ncbi:hypothetical protein AMAG_12074 [Allomyces macrogynus ATCC 38327]|uniref:GST C-terminal domain-containing protein n=1 Tax=Allomyces macrogynus (strain ATCC 38327) TaxID=578462 RepID=A0A0L0SYY9_ALLM3|nr:hypothetical protein AMAG_12074 [Allomyces macrogynus ATCC 38327]|eukprot:KNE67620.1 hypothetical protein AMAG_12074 [Allomyces macrogynus ATCC 38327]